MSIASQSTQQRFPFGYEEVFNGLIKILPDLEMDVKNHDSLIGRITVTSVATAFSWGENITLILEQVDESSTNLKIESSLKIGLSLSGSHRHQKNFNEIISTLSQYLRSPESYKSPERWVVLSWAIRITAALVVLAVLWKMTGLTFSELTYKLKHLW